MNARSAAIGGLAAGAGATALVGALLARVARPTGEIERYADDVAVAADGIAGNLAATEMLQRTSELADTVLALVAERRRDERG
ncbi:hypothetical protein [Pseudonocardia nigra]|uniref:hypothetical protein n=1 Tax=Pseudonocardia nigra TaxID=1921578 RepID=UPI001C5FA6DE|nr:hypothetical protein [Pseudonocardia nigra]